MMKILITFFLVFIFFSAISAEEITNFRPCLNSKCTIKKLYISPCPEALDGNPCEFPAGINATVIMEYIPHFSAQKPKLRFYNVQLLLDIPHPFIDPDGCLYTSCPLQANVTQKFKYESVTSNLEPRGDYLSKLRLWDDSENAKYEDQCCVLMEMKLV
ncbi:MD-2-related lipid-recognition protein-like [Daktulosphaira vitifoliae]|uniref:MD-2-related lipid-recognition protein-like n=1 Tax=Daktulosphaira vitifoliae TaxID=58002 RepID=UPI0021A9827D|nr:MD-2-related lipid-recognition protein-like [Daktulosphaira vitifoliae]